MKFPRIVITILRSIAPEYGPLYQTSWPGLSWDSDVLAARLREVAQLQGRLLGKLERATKEADVASVLDAQLQNIIQSFNHWPLRVNILMPNQYVLR